MLLLQIVSTLYSKIVYMNHRTYNHRNQHDCQLCQIFLSATVCKHVTLPICEWFWLCRFYIDCAFETKIVYYFVTVLWVNPSRHTKKQKTKKWDLHAFSQNSGKNPRIIFIMTLVSIIGFFFDGIAPIYWANHWDRYTRVTPDRENWNRGERRR